jgi:hypothetical protein
MSIQFELGSLANPNWFFTASTSMLSRVGTHRSRTHPPRDVASKGRIIQGTHCPRDALSKGRIIQGTHCPRGGISDFFRSGTPPYGSYFLFMYCIRVSGNLWSFPPNITPCSNPSSPPPPPPPPTISRKEKNN